MGEIHRILKPGGLFFFTTHGTTYRTRLATDELSRFDDGESVVQFQSIEGSNLCAAYHPPSWIKARLLADFELLELRETHLLDHSERSALAQDRWLIRRRS